MKRVALIFFGWMVLFTCHAQGTEEVLLSDEKYWRSFDSGVLKNKKSWKTDDWNNFSPDEIHYPPFSFSYPSNWKFNGFTVFNTVDGLKIAELTPALIKLKGGQSCWDRNDPEIKFLQNHEVQFGNLRGRKIVAEILPDGSDKNWHTYNYCLSNGEFAFVMHFWIRDINVASEQTFDRVISTLKLAAPTQNNAERKSIR